MSSVNFSWSSAQPTQDRFSAAQDALRASLKRLTRTGADDVRADAAEAKATASGGVAVNFSAASRHLAATSLQHSVPDETLDQTAQILQRMGELKDFAADPAATEDALAAYREEFGQLQSTLAGLTDETGALLYADAEPVPTGSESVSAESEPAAAVALPAWSGQFSDDFSNGDNWESAYGALSAQGGVLNPNSAGGYGFAQTKAAFSGPMEIKFDLFLPGAGDSLDLSIGGTTLSRLADMENTAKWQQHSVRIVYDGQGAAATFLDGADEAADVRTGLGALGGVLGLENYGLGSARLSGFSVVSLDADAAQAALQGSMATAAAVDAGEGDGTEYVDESGGISAADESADAEVGSGAVSEVAHAPDLDSLDEATLAQAIEEISAQQAESAGESGIGLVSEESQVASSDEAGQLTETVRQEILAGSADDFLAQAGLDARHTLMLLS